MVRYLLCAMSHRQGVIHLPFNDHILRAEGEQSLTAGDQSPTIVFSTPRPFVDPAPPGHRTLRPTWSVLAPHTLVSYDHQMILMVYSFPVSFIKNSHGGPITMEPLMGGPQCHMSILRNGNVACLCRLFFSMSHVEFKK